MFVELKADLVMLDVHMPYLDGFEVVELLRPLKPDNEYLPTMIITADIDPTLRRRANVAGVEDFLCKPFQKTEVVARVKNLLETRSRHLGARGDGSERPEILRVPDTEEGEHFSPVYQLMPPGMTSGGAACPAWATGRRASMSRR